MQVVIVREDKRNVRRKVSEDEDDGTEVYLLVATIRVFAIYLCFGSLGKT